MGANTRFGLRLIRQLAPTVDGPNVVISSSGVMATLAMMRVGALGRPLELIEAETVDGFLGPFNPRSCWPFVALIRDEIIGCILAAAEITDPGSLWAGVSGRRSPSTGRCPPNG